MAERRFYYNERVMREAEVYFEAGNAVLLFGPPGSGKTSLALYLAEKNGWGVELLAGGESMRDEDMLGVFRVRGKEVEWVDGPLARAFKRAASGEKVLLVIDELTRIPSRYLNVFVEMINDYDYDRWVLYNHMTGEKLVADKEKLKIFATANVNQVGTNDIPEALLDRFEYHMHVGYPGPTEELRIAMKWGASEFLARVLVRFARITREMARDGRIEFPVSTRVIVQVSRSVGRLKRAGRIRSVAEEIDMSFRLMRGCVPYLAGATRGRVDWDEVAKMLFDVYANVCREEQEKHPEFLKKGSFAFAAREAEKEAEETEKKRVKEGKEDDPVDKVEKVIDMLDGEGIEMEGGREERDRGEKEGKKGAGKKRRKKSVMVI